MNKSPNLQASLKYALQGIRLVLRRERNLRIHLVISLLVLVLAAWLRLERTDWLILILTMAMVLAAEVMNSAVEYLVDLSTLEYHHLAKAAKDAAAGAVLLTAAAAVLVGLLIFGPRLLTLL